jgi:hypothetical protein
MFAEAAPSFTVVVVVDVGVSLPPNKLDASQAPVKAKPIRADGAELDREVPIDTAAQTVVQPGL